MKSPADAIVAVTSRCNSRCAMCNVWKSACPDMLKPRHMKKLPPLIKTVNLTGGEPFLRDDLPDFVREVRDRCPKAKITISTNGYDADRIESMMNRIREIDPNVRLAVSIDGPREMHNRIRGGNLYDSAVDLIERLQNSGFRGLRLAMTVWVHNADCLEQVVAMADKYRLELGVMPAHEAETHLDIDAAKFEFNTTAARRGFRRVIMRWLRSWSPKRWLRAHFTAVAYRYLTGRPLKVKCRAGRDFFFVRSDGTVFTCSVKGRELGNLTTGHWDGIWLSNKSIEARKDGARCGRYCWMICTARSIYRAKWLAISAWILWNKLLSHLRLFSLPGRSGGR